MRFAKPDHFLTGVSIPVSALRSAEGCGVGEFADLPLLGRWCRRTGIELIQLLPVNDTGGNSSPYSALSAYALHPLYLRLDALPGFSPFAAETRDFALASEARLQQGERYSYRQTLSFKLSIIERIFADIAPSLLSDDQFAEWRQANPWIVPYAVFTALKRETAEAPWASWGELADPTPDGIADYWASHQESCLLHAWVQYMLEGQLRQASEELARLGVALKGDIPILMSEQSADVWAARGFFDLSSRAGAPPDMFSPDGQNWGFPVYDWDRLAEEGYRWWKDRLRQAAKFFHAIRIDHVLGFFRIWGIPRSEKTGLLGHFSPSLGVSPDDLHELGFDDDRIRWLSLPHVNGAELAAGAGEHAARVAGRYLLRIGNEQLYNLDPSIDGEAAIAALDEPPEIKRFLCARHVDRALLAAGDGLYHPFWYIERTKGFQSLGDKERSGLQDLLGWRRGQSENLWERRGRELLRMLRDSTDMLVCAEDLGDVPDCVPRVLSDLGILGLRIVRWARDYKHAAAGVAPFIPPERHPRLSVCTPSVHDTSTLRAWWEEDAAEREAYYATLGLAEACPAHMSRALLEKIVERCMRADSLLCVFQIQDLLDCDEGLWSADPRDDRINVPGTVTDRNWTWRMPVPISDLTGRAALTARLSDLTRKRRERMMERP